MAFSRTNRTTVSCVGIWVQITPGHYHGRGRFTYRLLVSGNGERDRIRTCDPVIKSHLLYQLSYAPESQIRIKDSHPSDVWSCSSLGHRLAKSGFSVYPKKPISHLYFRVVSCCFSCRTYVLVTCFSHRSFDQVIFCHLLRLIIGNYDFPIEIEQRF